ncbi:hypothetical protein CR513_40667, partial [Mucuna pruriens]
MSRSKYLFSSMHHRQLYIRRCNAGLRSLNQRYANISIQVAQIWGSRADRDGNPTCQQERCATLGCARRCSLSDFCVLDMEDEASKKGSALILGQPFFMTIRTKINVYAGTLSMEFGNTSMKFNIFEALKHPAEDHSIFNIDTIDGLVEEYVRMGTSNAYLVDFVEMSNAKSNFSQLTPSTKETSISPQSPTPKLKPLPKHLKYAYMENHQQFSLRVGGEVAECTQEAQERNQLDISRPSKHQPLYLHAQDFIGGGCPTDKVAVVETESNPTGHAGIIYPISDSQWVSSVQVVLNKSGITIVKNRQDKMKTISSDSQGPLPIAIYRPSTGKIHIAPVDQHKTSFTCLFGTFAYTRMSFGLCNDPSTFQRWMINIFSDLFEDYMEIFMDDFTLGVSKSTRQKSILYFLCLNSPLCGRFNLFLGPAGFQQDRSASVQAATKGRRLCLPPILRGRFLGAEEKTHFCTYPPNTELRASVRIDVRHVELYTRSCPKIANRQATACHCLCISDNESN